jgi:hypothetical protein
MSSTNPAQTLSPAVPMMREMRVARERPGTTRDGFRPKRVLH